MSDAYTSSRIDDLPTLWGGMCKLVRVGLGLGAFGVNVLDIGPDYVTTDHTESESGQEELYLVLRGAATLLVGAPGPGGSRRARARGRRARGARRAPPLPNGAGRRAPPDRRRRARQGVRGAGVVVRPASEREPGPHHPVAMPGLPSVEIAPGVEMPLVGLGTWQATGARAQAAVLRALEVGYRLIDTATMYGNEREVGRALRDSGVPRDELFITTKLPSGNAGRERETIAASLEALGRRPARSLARALAAGRARAAADLGAVRRGARRGPHARDRREQLRPGQIDEIVDATGVTPAVNQIRWSPALYDADLVAAHRQRGVALEGYSPFLSTDLGNRVLAEIAERHGATTRQVVVRWHVEHGFVVIPKSTDPGRIAANLDVLGFTLDDSEVARIDALGR